jgi:hypothetical protein
MSEATSTAPILIRIEAARCALYYRYVRLEILVHAEGDPVEIKNLLTASLLFDAASPPQSFHYSKLHAGGEHELVLDAMIDPDRFPDAGHLTVTLGTQSREMSLTDFAAYAGHRNTIGALTWNSLITHINQFVAENPDRRPRLMDLGGRRFIGGTYADDLAQCDVTVFDIVEDDRVDVVGDAHEMSKYFPPEHFDFIMSASVFEHLLMPWKVALELNKVMRTGGFCYIHTHQTLGMHELPWDFWRYSDTVWPALFNARTGFEIVATGLGQFMQLVTVGWAERYRGAENSGGFECSGVLVRKTGPSDLTWNVGLDELIATHYPTHR